MKECNNDGTKKERNEQYRRRKESQQSAARMKREKERKKKERRPGTAVYERRECCTPSGRVQSKGSRYRLTVVGPNLHSAADWPYQVMAAALVPDGNSGSKQMNPFCACPAP